MSVLPHDILSLLFNNYFDARSKFAFAQTCKRYYVRENMFQIRLAAMKQKTNDETQARLELITVCQICGAVCMSKNGYNKHMQKHTLNGEWQISADIRTKSELIVKCYNCKCDTIYNSRQHKCWSRIVPCRKIDFYNKYGAACLQMYDFNCPDTPDFYYGPKSHNSCKIICKACDKEVMTDEYEYIYNHITKCSKQSNIPYEYIKHLRKAFNLQYSLDGVEKFESNLRFRARNLIARQNANKKLME